MQISMAVPISNFVCKEIESLLRNFRWPNGPTQVKRNQVRWEIFVPAAGGGLGTRTVGEPNEACSLKLDWLAAISDSLCAQWAKNKYFKAKSIWNSTNSLVGSCTWKKMHSLLSFLKLGRIWKVGNGRTISLWHGNWVDDSDFASCSPQFEFSNQEIVSQII